jgi:hypothetical protein
MGVTIIHCEGCGENEHEDDFERCLICCDTNMCVYCKNETIKFKCGKRYVCKECICEPLSSQHMTEEGAEKVNMKLKAFLKVIQETKDVLYNPIELIKDSLEEIEKLNKKIDKFNIVIKEQLLLINVKKSKVKEIEVKEIDVKESKE